MSNVRYNAGTMTIEVDGLDDVSAVLGDLRKKTPAGGEGRHQRHGRQARKLMIAEAKARYAVNSAGKRHLSDLVQRKKASNSSLSAEAAHRKRPQRPGHISRPGRTAPSWGMTWRRPPSISRPAC